MDERGLRGGSTPVALPQSRAAVLVAGEETGGRFALLEAVAERGAELPRHLHNKEDETLYVLEGSLSVCVGGEWIEASAGTAVFLTRGVEHAFTVTSERTRLLVFLTPAGFEGFYREMDGVGPEVERLVTTASRYGCEITGPALERTRESGCASAMSADVTGRAGRREEAPG